MIVVLTGGIGCGKTTVANMFKNLNVPVIDADQIAFELVQNASPYLEKIVHHFGRNILNHDGNLDRQKLRKKIFAHTEEKKWLENLLHPAIYQVIYEKALETKTPYCILSIPLFVETANLAPFIPDRILVIVTDYETRINRVRERDHLTETFAKAIIQSQTSDDNRLQQATDIIENNGDLNHLKKEVILLHQFYLGMAENKNFSK